ncbi:MAG: M23 family peptidase, partial [Alphaproteobacteria bacterium]|nr:M23 family peptidase [Alphaproteobacteria bacterium]
MTVQDQSPESSWFERFLPVRYLYLRSRDDIRAYALTAQRQLVLGAVAVAVVLWSLVASGAFLFDLIAQHRSDAEVVRARAASERLNADLQA